MGYIRIRKEEPPAGITWASPSALYTDTGDEIERVIYNGNTIWGASAGGWSKTENWSGSGSIRPALWVRTDGGDTPQGSIRVYTLRTGSESGSNPTSIPINNPFPFAVRVSMTITRSGSVGPGGTVTINIPANGTGTIQGSSFGGTSGPGGVGTFSWGSTAPGASAGSPSSITFSILAVSDMSYTNAYVSYTDKAPSFPSAVTSAYSWGAPTATANAQHVVDGADPYIRLQPGSGTIRAECIVKNGSYTASVGLTSENPPQLQFNTDGQVFSDTPATVVIQARVSVSVLATISGILPVYTSEWRSFSIPITNNSGVNTVPLDALMTEYSCTSSYKHVLRILGVGLEYKLATPYPQVTDASGTIYSQTASALDYLWGGSLGSGTFAVSLSPTVSSGYQMVTYSGPAASTLTSIKIPATPDMGYV